MQVVGIIIFVVLAGFVTWLVVDTTIYVIKKVKDKKRAKRGGARLDSENVIDNETTNK